MAICMWQPRYNSARLSISKHRKLKVNKLLSRWSSRPRQTRRRKTDEVSRPQRLLQNNGLPLYTGRPANLTDNQSQGVSKSDQYRYILMFLRHWKRCSCDQVLSRRLNILLCELPPGGRLRIHFGSDSVASTLLNLRRLVQIRAWLGDPAIHEC
jgi:hypothetical protein